MATKPETATPVLYILKVKSGTHAGRYVGRNIGEGGLVTNPELLKNREVKVPGTRYSLYAQKQAATRFFYGDGLSIAIAELHKAGCATESESVE